MPLLHPPGYATGVCSDHFVSGKPSQLYEVNNEDWAPSQNLGYDRLSEGSKRSERASRAVARSSRKRLREELAGENMLETTEDITEGSRIKDAETQTTLSGDVLESNYEHTKHVEKELQELQMKVEQLAPEEDIGVKLNRMDREMKEPQAELKESRYNEDAFKQSNEKVRFYTGLTNWELLHILLLFIQPYLRQRSVLTPFQQLLITLMRLRLNLSVKDLAYRFGVHYSTISCTYLAVLNILYYRLKPLILWPERDVLFKTMPMSFRKHYPRCNYHRLL